MHRSASVASITARAIRSTAVPSASPGKASAMSRSSKGQRLRPSSAPSVFTQGITWTVPRGRACESTPATKFSAYSPFTSLPCTPATIATVGPPPPPKVKRCST